jgi:phosphate transport system ATP-binding protein
LQQPAVSAQPAQNTSKVAIDVQQLNAWYGGSQALFDVNLSIVPLSVSAAIGPSGSGKSTFIRCLNRMHEEILGGRVSGKVLIEGVNIYDSDIQPMNVRRHIGMVFQQPNPLPSRSIYENVAIGARINGLARGNALNELVERCLRHAALWEEVKDRLNAPPTQLSGGQQQRLCIARALALEPRIVLMDEPCSALDPIATLQIEDLIRRLKQQYTIVIVTHNLQQAARVADRTAFFLSGHLIEEGETAEFFSRPRRKETEDFITGRFG